MKVVVAKSYSDMSARAHELFKQKFIFAESIGFATGKTPLGLYKLIAKDYLAGKISFKGRKTFNLDEYYPISAADKRSYRYYMEKNLFSKTDIERSRIYFPNSEMPEDAAVDVYAGQYSKSGPIGLQILGIGINGHIGFNEPGSSIDSRIRLVKLSTQTIKRNKAPSEYAITMGISEIMKAKSIIIMASGKDKCDAIEKMVNGKVGKEVPASFLQLHDDATLIVDKAAAKKLGL